MQQQKLLRTAGAVLLVLSLAVFVWLTGGAVADEPTAEITAFTSRGPNLLTFAWIPALERGRRYRAVPLRSADGSRWFTGSGHNVSVEVEG